ncbi:MAG: Coenzyme F420 hydrogenase/dehydrogenase, beta subunit C-terminal domain [Candidatus Helarchaeota archaeon]
MNVEITRDLNLCVSCEICRAVCPMNAIEMEYKGGQFLPKIDKNKCINCEDCIKVCPGIDIEVFEEDNFEDWLNGIYIKAYSAYSKDPEILKNSTSGGIITHLILELLKRDNYEGAFVLPFNMMNKESVKLSLAKNEEEVIESAKSKYLPASAYNLIGILNRKSSYNYIIVGTPCQIKGIKNFINLRKINEKNLLFLGLFCDKTLNFNLLKYFEDKFAKDNEKLKKFEYRNKEKGGWPGHIKMYFDSRREVIVDRTERIRLKEFFQLERCLYCLDKLNRHSDISFGDCYIPGKDNPGRSSIIIRTNKGMDIWNKYSDRFQWEKSDIKLIKRAQGMCRKRDNLSYSRILMNKEEFFGKNYETVDKSKEKELNNLRKKISLGRENKTKQIEIYLFINKFKKYLCYFENGLKLLYVMLYSYLKDILLNKSYLYNKKKEGNLLIFGGGLGNKGAQAMTFTVVDQIRRIYPQKNIYLLHCESYQREDKERYKFEILPIKYGSIVNLLIGKRIINLPIITCSYEEEKKLKKIIENTEIFLDISGYVLSSQVGGETLRIPISFSQLEYISRIMLAYKLGISYIILPQSIGPFNYNFINRLLLFPIMHKYLKYPKKIYDID